jgi:hypothetical protein
MIGRQTNRGFDPSPLILQARKPCGCVTAATMKGCGNDSTGTWRVQYEREGNKVHAALKIHPTFTRPCTHGPIIEQLKKGLGI